MRSFLNDGKKFTRSFLKWTNPRVAGGLFLLGHPIFILFETIFRYLSESSVKGRVYSWISQTTRNFIKAAGSERRGPVPRRYRSIITKSQASPEITFKRIILPTKRGSPNINSLVFLFPSVGVFLGLIFASAFWFFVLRDLPHPSDLVRKPRPLTTRIYDRNGNLLYKIFRNQNRTYIPLRDIPISVQQATIAFEDAEFYSHPGFSLRGMARAVERNMIRGQLTGGSTITQQLVKNALLNPQKTFQRKIKEMVLALWTEMTFPKDKILEMYLNEVSYGGTSYGIEEAAQVYFGKAAKDLTLAEAALLAGLPSAPTRFSPFGANPNLAKVRQEVVLARMTEEGYITPLEQKEAESREMKFSLPKTEIKAPHFSMWVRQLLAEKYGERIIEEGGLEITTTLDLETQRKVEEIVSSEVNSLGRLRVTNGAALVTKPGTGEVLAMVGSRSYFNSKEGNFNVTTAPRQPGSSIKPINYAYALSHNYNPSTLIDDSPVSFKTGGAVYSPRNYDSKFRGRVTLRTALGSSLNVPAVRVLASYGVDQMVEQGRKMGITTWDNPQRFGLSLTLGSGEVKMTDLSVAYATLANYGEKVELWPIIKITDHSGRVLEESKCPKGKCGEQVLDPKVAFLLTDILSDNRARTPVFGPRSLLVIPNHPEIAVKTGTSQNLRDNWAIGYNKEFVVAAWIGNNDNAQMSRIASGVTGATPIWHKIVSFLVQKQTNGENYSFGKIGEVRAAESYWEPPEGVVRVSVCPATNTLSCEGCRMDDWFIEGREPKNRCVIRPPEAEFPNPSPTPAPLQTPNPPN